MPDAKFGLETYSNLQRCTFLSYCKSSSYLGKKVFFFLFIILQNGGRRKKYFPGGEDADDRDILDRARERELLRSQISKVAGMRHSILV